MTVPRAQQSSIATSAELRLLLCCARRHLSSQQRTEIRTLLSGPLDWNRLISLAGRHKMLPLLWWHLKPELERIPPGSAALLQRLFLENAASMLRLSAELLALGRRFAANGIPMVSYKGPVLGAYLYGNLALRQAGDLDLLIRRQDVPRTRAILSSQGYRPRHVLSHGGEEFMFQSRYSEEFEKGDGSVVELHWAFTNGDVGFSLDLDALLPRVEETHFAGGVLQTFGRDDLLLILCIHGSKHRWDRLEWLCGVAELLRVSSSDLAWRQVLERASELGARRMLLLGVLLAHDLLGAPVHVEFVQAARADRTVAHLADEVPRLFLTDAVDGDGAGNLATDLFRYQLRERRRDRFRFIWYRLTTPSHPESWSAVSLGKHWFPLHGFVRPFRVLSKLIPAIQQYRQASKGRN